jgi:glycosyltransferase involved in cell wall biosynthesis
MLVGLDATPLLGQRTGVGRYVAELLTALQQLPPAPDEEVTQPVATAFSLRGRRQLAGLLPPGVADRSRPLPARLLQRVWARHGWPSVTSLMGHVDVFHATNFVLPPTGRAAGVVTVHDLSFLSLPGTVTSASRAYRELVPLSIRRARLVLTPSHAVAGELTAAYGLSPDRVVVTHLGVGPEWGTAAAPDAALRRLLGLPERYFVFVGNLEPRKNLPLLLDAYRALLAERPDAPGLVLAGPAGWGPTLDLRGIPARQLVFTGYRSDRELRSVVAGATALVYPTAYEGFGLPPLEAFAAGVPVIASDLPVVREVVGTGAETAALVPAGDATALAAALAHQVDADDPAPAAAARRRRAAEFTWSATAAATRSAYVRALGSQLSEPDT